MAKRTTKLRKKVRSATGLATLDGFLKGQGKLEKFQAIAIKEILADKSSKP
jgi:hypothetical protein